MTQLRYMLRKRPLNFLPSVRATGRPSPREPRQPQVLGRRLRRWSNLPSGLPGPVNPWSPWLLAYLWWDGPAPTGQNATDHEVGIAREDRMGLTDARTPPDIILLDRTMDVKRVSGPDPRLRAGPAPGDRRIRRVVQGPAVFRGRWMSGLQPLPLIPITIITSHRVIVGPCLHHHRGRWPTASLRLVIIKREDERVLRGLVHPTSPDGKYSCPRPLPNHQREEPSRWFLRRPGQNTWKNLQLKWRTQRQWRVRQRLWRGQQMKARQVTARQMTTRQVTAQQMTAQHMTDQQVTGQQEMTSQSLWMIRKKLPTQQVNSQQRTAQHFMMTTRQVWPAQHTIRPWHWTAQQPMVLQQGTRHRQDKTQPFWRVSAVLFSRQCQQLSTRLHWLTSCPCGLWCCDGWTRVWLFPMPRPGRLHNQLFLLPEMMTPHPGGPRLHLGRQTDDPGRQWDGPGHPWEEPGGWTTLESPHAPVLQSDGLHRLIYLPEMLLLWIFRRLWTLRTRSRRGPLPTMRMKTAITRRSRQRSINQSFRQAGTTSKGSFKVNPAKSRRASRASLLDLGDSEVSDQVSWLDQPSLKDTMASTARIAQGLKEDEKVEKTTLSETLNTTSSTF